MEISLCQIKLGLVHKLQTCELRGALTSSTSGLSIGNVIDICDLHLRNAAKWSDWKAGTESSEQIIV